MSDLVHVQATHSFEPRDINEALAVARTLVASRLLPKSVGTPEAAFAIIMTGREMGLTAMQALRSIHVIEGKPTMSADLMLALVKRSNVCQYFRLVESTAEIATYECLRTGEPAPTRMSFALEEAKAAGLVGKDNWRKYPAAMLRARCIAALARAVFPDVMLGVYETDELAPAPSSAPVVAVVEQPGPDSSGDISAVSVFLARVEAATTVEELGQVAADVGKVSRQLSRADRDRIVAAGKARKIALGERPSGSDVEAAQ